MFASLSSADFGLEDDPAEAMGLRSWLKDGLRRADLPRRGADGGASEEPGCRALDAHKNAQVWRREARNKRELEQTRLMSKEKRTKVVPERVKTIS